MSGGGEASGTRQTDGQLSVLVVDDDPLITRILEKILGGLGYEVVEAATGRRASELVGSRDFDAVLADQNLGDCEGLALLDALEEDLRSTRRRVPALVVMSGAVAAAWERPSLEKPFDVAVLRSVLEAEIERAGGA